MEQQLKEVHHEDTFDRDSLVRVHIHKDLESEFQYWREIFEKKAGYNMSGGKPVVSKYIAEILNKLRTRKERENIHIVVEFRKIPRTGKCKVSFL